MIVVDKNEIYTKTSGKTYIDISTGSVFYFRDDEDKNVCMKIDTGSYVDLSNGLSYVPTRAENIARVYVYDSPRLYVEEYI